MGHSTFRAFPSTVCWIQAGNATSVLMLLLAANGFWSPARWGDLVPWLVWLTVSASLGTLLRLAAVTLYFAAS